MSKFITLSAIMTNLNKFSVWVSIDNNNKQKTNVREKKMFGVHDWTNNKLAYFYIELCIKMSIKLIEKKK